MNGQKFKTTTASLAHKCGRAPEIGASGVRRSRSAGNVLEAEDESGFLDETLDQFKNHFSRLCVCGCHTVIPSLRASDEEIGFATRFKCGAVWL